LAQRPNLLCLAAARAPGHFTRRLGAIAEIRHGRKVDALARSDPLDTAEEELVVELGQREGTSGFYISQGYDGVRARKVPGVFSMSLQENGVTLGEGKYRIDGLGVEADRLSRDGDLGGAFERAACRCIGQRAQVREGEQTLGVGLRPTQKGVELSGICLCKAFTLSFRTSDASFLPPPLGLLGGSDREGFELACEGV